jgi:3-oxoadipate enol-lactonase
MAERFAEVNGTKLHYTDQGNGQALVLIHAGFGNLEMWDDQVQAFAGHYRVIRYDLRGWGMSPSPPGKFSHHEDLAALLRHLEVKTAAILGSSMGGGVAIDFSLAHPEMVWALIVVAPAISGYPMERNAAIEQRRLASYQAYQSGDLALAAELTAQTWVDGPLRSPQEVDPVVRRRGITMIRQLYELPQAQGQAQGLVPPAIDRLEEIRVPTLIISGDLDVSVMEKITQILAYRVAGATSVILHGAAHLCNMEKPHEFNRVVLEFLDAGG